MGKRYAFDVRAAIPAAWAMLWANNLKQRVENEKKKHVYREGSTYFLTASDVENQVREFANMTLQGKPWSEAPIAFGKPMHWPVIRISGNLKSIVRDWLLREVRAGRLDSHNFGRGHISGMRFRPTGEPISEAEKGTMEAKAKRTSKPRPVHFADKSTGYKCLCTATRKRSLWSRHRSQAHCTMERQRVTCPRCLKLMEGK